MKIIYICYREDNTLIFESQVLEYLKMAKKNNHQVELILFRNHKNLFKKKYIENKISDYVDICTTYFSFPALFKLQIIINLIRAKIGIEKKYNKNEKLLVMCRGEFSTYIGKKIFSKYKNVHILYDNRGLPIEELEMKNKKNILYLLNKNVKKKMILLAKDYCDSYSFVTNNLRNYLIKNYQYSSEKKYFIIPTLTEKKKLEVNIFEKIKNELEYQEKNFYVIYIGSVAVWQSIEDIIKIYTQIFLKINKVKMIILTNGEINYLNKLEKNIKESIIVKSVSHTHVKYYLEISNLGIVLREDNIVNRVAAPTKISEYVTYNVPILHTGNIGVLDDLNFYENNFISINDKNWIEKILNLRNKKTTEKNDKSTIEYFDMEKRQIELIINI